MVLKYINDCILYSAMRRRLVGWRARSDLKWALSGVILSLTYSTYLILHNQYYSNSGLYLVVAYSIIFWTSFSLAYVIARGSPQLRNHGWPTVVLIIMVLMGAFILNEIAIPRIRDLYIIYLTIGIIVGSIFTYLQFRLIKRGIKNGTLTKKEIFAAEKL
jgi:hypothetical protein